ncbi:MAG: ATP synthase F1 subunit delta [Kiritimatiellae bacterium]|nr:ATP synthase F1 subunit delta [Kiritimatiellia bacterium]
MSSANSEALENYAAALLHLAVATDQLAEIEHDLTKVQDLMVESEELRCFLANPVITAEGKTTALRRLLGADISQITLEFLDILVLTGTIRRLNAIVESFFRQLAARRNKVSGEIVTAVPLSPEIVATIEKETSRILGKDVSLRVRVAPDLLGGIYLRVGNFVIDGTLDHQLELLAEALRL